MPLQTSVLRNEESKACLCSLTTVIAAGVPLTFSRPNFNFCFLDRREKFNAAIKQAIICDAMHILFSYNRRCKEAFINFLI